MSRNRFIALGALLLAGSVPSMLYANCAPAIEAFEKAWSLDRLAQYDIESPDQPLTGRPFVVRIGRTVWTDMGDYFNRNDNATGGNPMVQNLKTRTASGEAKCSPAGAGLYRGEAAVKYRIEGAIGSGSTTGPIILWVSKSRGLPLYHEFEKLQPGGYAWVYGDSVKPPAGRVK